MRVEFPEGFAQNARKTPLMPEPAQLFLGIFSITGAKIVNFPLGGQGSPVYESRDTVVVVRG